MELIDVNSVGVKTANNPCDVKTLSPPKTATNAQTTNQDGNVSTRVYLYSDMCLILGTRDYFTLRSLLLNPTSSFFYSKAQAPRKCNWKLSSFGLKTKTDPNAGGGSIVSEYLSAEILFRLLNYQDLITEMGVVYKAYGGNIADFLLGFSNNGRKFNVGVSVARAMGYPSESVFDLDQARRLMVKKLNGLIVARSGVVKSQRFYASIVHFIAQSSRIADLLYEAWEEQPAEYKDDLIVLCTVCEGGFTCAYENCEQCK